MTILSTFFSDFSTIWMIFLLLSENPNYVEKAPANIQIAKHFF